MRIFTSLILLVTGLLTPFSAQQDPQFSANIQILEGQSAFVKYFVSPWYRWDSLHYIRISEQGYSIKIDTAWPPLYPSLIKVFSTIFQPDLLAALLVSTLAAALAMALLYFMVQETWDEKTARLTLLYLAFFPTAFFLMAAYTESLFLALSIGCLYAFKKSKWAASAIFGAAATLTRLQAIALIVPLAWVVIDNLSHRRVRSFGQLARLTLPCAAILMAFLGYSIYVHYGLGADWPWQTISSTWVQHFGWPWEGLWGNFASLTFRPISTSLPGFARFYDLFLMCAAIGLLIWARKKIPVYFLIYGASQILIILTKVGNDGLLVGAGRYLLPVFPVMIAAALNLNKTVRSIWLAISIGSQVFLLILFYWWVWVA